MQELTSNNLRHGNPSINIPGMEPNKRLFLHERNIVRYSAKGLIAHSSQMFARTYVVVKTYFFDIPRSQQPDCLGVGPGKMPAAGASPEIVNVEFHLAFSRQRESNPRLSLGRAPLYH